MQYLFKRFFFNYSLLQADASGQVCRYWVDERLEQAGAVDDPSGEDEEPEGGGGGYREISMKGTGE